MTNSLTDIKKLFPAEAKAVKHLQLALWEGEPKCPYCGSTYQTPFKSGNRFKCNNCNMSFSVTTQTFFHKTRVDLRKWFYVIELILSDTKPAVRVLGTELGVTKDTANFLLNRVIQARKKNEALLYRIVNYKIK